MKDDSRYHLDGILCDWHRWATGWTGVAAHGACAMFAGFRSSRQWDGEGDIADATIHNTRMKAVDFHVSELAPMHRTALQIQARNLSTGRSVWNSARLPADVQERALVLADARIALTKRLQTAGVM